MTDSKPPMQLIPKSPPGRRTRKARAFADEITRLRAEGYTCEAIREALAAAGVQVSKSTVQREATRIERRSPAPRVSALSIAPARQPSATTVLEDAPSSAPGIPTSRSTPPLTGKAIAEAFMQGRTTNPLLRKETSK